MFFESLDAECFGPGSNKCAGTWCRLVIVIYREMCWWRSCHQNVEFNQKQASETLVSQHPQIKLLQNPVFLQVFHRFKQFKIPKTFFFVFGILDLEKRQKTRNFAFFILPIDKVNSKNQKIYVCLVFLVSCRSPMHMPQPFEEHRAPPWSWSAFASTGGWPTLGIAMWRCRAPKDKQMFFWWAASGERIGADPSMGKCDFEEEPEEMDIEEGSSLGAGESPYRSSPGSEGLEF